MDWLYLISGLLILVVGGEFLVKGAVSLAQQMKVSSLVIGMTVVSFGTSAPELLVSVQAALQNHPDIAVANVLGSNISNIGLVLGITVCIFPIIIDRNTLRVDWPMMMGATILFFLFILDGYLDWWEGAILLVIVIVFTVWLIRKSRKSESTDKPLIKKAWYITALHILIGMVGLYFGSEFLLDGAVGIAKSLNMSEHTIGVTIIAFGTSVPELVASIVAALRKETDISVGNLIGSNLFNINVVLGITSLIKRIPFSEHVLTNDIYWVLGISLVLLPLMLTRRKLSRWEGGVLLLSYVIYVYSVLS